MMYRGIVHVNYIEDGFCILESYVYCMVALHHLHQTGGRLDPYKCPDVVEDVLRHVRIKLPTSVQKEGNSSFFFLLVKMLFIFIKVHSQLHRFQCYSSYK